MAQHDYIIDNQTSASLRADLNNALAAIVSQNSGATAPSTTYANQFWYDTANDQLKQRNETNSAWIILGTVNQTTNKFEPNQTFASQAEAETGTNNTLPMTPLRVAQSIAANSSATNYQVFTASGTWTKPAGLSADAIVVVHLWAGGGGGGKGDSDADNAAGGGGGGFVQAQFLASTLASTVAVSVGAGGAGQTSDGLSGSDGGNSSFSTALIYGGTGGRGGASSGNRDGAKGGGWSSARIGGGDLDDGTDVQTYPDQFGGGAGNGAGILSTVGGFWGGGGGASTIGGVTTSVFAGAGGASRVDGTAPAGGGGGSTRTGNGGNGARGEVRVWTIG